MVVDVTLISQVRTVPMRTPRMKSQDPERWYKFYKKGTISAKIFGFIQAANLQHMAHFWCMLDQLR